MFGDMQPSGRGARRSHMKRTRLATLGALAALTASLVLVGCGAEPDEDTVATDPTSAPTDTPTPTEEPTVGTYPDFAPDDYTYTLVTSCFCPDAGAPVRVTVVAGDAVSL